MNKISLDFFCFWEIDKIGLNITIDQKLTIIDLSIEEAIDAQSKLNAAIEAYKKLEKNLKTIKDVQP